MKPLSFYFILLCLPLIANSQKNIKEDSLLRVYEGQPDGFEKVETLNALFNATMYQDAALAKKYADEMLSLSEKINDNKGIGMSFYQLGVYHTNLNNIDSARTYYNQSIALQDRLVMKEQKLMP